MNDFTNGDPVIAARDLTKRYGRATAVDHIDFPAPVRGTR